VRWWRAPQLSGLRETTEAASRKGNAAVQPDNRVEDPRETDDLLKPDPAPASQRVGPDPDISVCPGGAGPGVTVPIAAETGLARVIVPATGRRIGLHHGNGLRARADRGLEGTIHRSP